MVIPNDTDNTDQKRIVSSVLSKCINVSVLCATPKYRRHVDTSGYMRIDSWCDYMIDQPIRVISSIVKTKLHVFKPIIAMPIRCTIDLQIEIIDNCISDIISSPIFNRAYSNKYPSMICDSNGDYLLNISRIGCIKIRLNKNRPSPHARIVVCRRHDVDKKYAFRLLFKRTCV